MQVFTVVEFHIRAILGKECFGEMAERPLLYFVDLFDGVYILNNAPIYIS